VRVGPVRVLAFGTFDVARHPRAGVLLAGLRQRGVEVDEAVRPLGLSTAERVRLLQQPWRLPVLVARLLARWAVIVRAGRRSVRRHPVDAVFVGYLGHFDVLLARLAFPRTTVVLDHLLFAGDTARDRGRSGLRARLLDALDRLALRCADVIVVDTDEHAALAPASRRAATVVCPVGAPEDWFRAGRAAEPGSAAGEAPLRVVFFGLYTPLQGAPVIGKALALLRDRPDIAVTMVGAGQDLDRTRTLAAGNPRVTWREWVEPDRLLELVAGHDVCLGIFDTGPKSHRVVPNKVFQGAAAGCVVVTSDTPPQRRALGAAAVYVPPGDPAALAAALTGLADDRARLAGLRRTSCEHARREFTPLAVSGPLHDVLSGLPA
jgi:glycosyltransferase involved in cell wall biosynthesis